jgi:hypothetical protein
MDIKGYDDMRKTLEHLFELVDKIEVDNSSVG